jgi:hypothetical protein
MQKNLDYRGSGLLAEDADLFEEAAINPSPSSTKEKNKV